jgi:DNA-binding CsgD family transcriptional regulator
MYRHKEDQAVADAHYDLGEIMNKTRYRSDELMRGMASVLRRATGVDAAGVMTFDGSLTKAASNVAIAGPWTEHEQEAFREQSQWSLDERVLIDRLRHSPAPIFRRTDEIMPIAEFHLSRLYNEFQRPRGLGDQATMLIEGPNGSHLVSAISRVDSDEPLSDSSVNIAQRLAPYMLRCWAGVSLAGPDWVRRLSPRRRRVFELVAQGLDDHQISSEMGVRYHTVRAHLKDLFRVAGVRSRLHLIQAAMSDGIETGSIECEPVEALA